MASSEDDVTTELSQDETRLLVKINRWVEGLIILSIVWNLFIGWFLFWRHGVFRWGGLLGIGALLVSWPVTRRARRVLVERGFEAHLPMICGMSWAVGLAFVLGHPDAFPVSALICSLPVMLGVIASQRALKRIILGSVAVLVVAALLTALVPAEEFMSREGGRRLYGVFMPLTLFVIFAQVWVSSTRLKNALREMRNSNRALAESERSLEHKVEERTSELAHKNEALARSQRELALARDAALEASRTKSTFLANMSHELRTPLNAIIGYSEMLQEEARDSGQEGFVPDLDKILSSGRYLLDLINGVLDLSKNEKMQKLLGS